MVPSRFYFYSISSCLPPDKAQQGENSPGSSCCVEENFLTQHVREPTREDNLAVCEQKGTVGNHLAHAIMKSVFDSQRRKQVEE